MASAAQKSKFAEAARWFVRGAASLLDFEGQAPRKPSVRIHSSIQEAWDADMRALNGDLRKVGDDMRKAITQYEQTQKQRPEITK